MIKNDRQLVVSRQQRDRLSTAVTGLAESGHADPISTAHLAMLQADIGKIDREIADYETAATGQFDPASITALDHVARDLVKARIAAGLTQEALAVMIHCKAQQVQRYEQSGYASASLKTLRTISATLLNALMVSRSKPPSHTVARPDRN